MSLSSSDVPGIYDVVLTGGSLASSAAGFCFLDSLEPNVPFRTHRAIYDISPTFIERQNVSGSFGDQQQDFWLTAAQHDWSLGEDQKFFQASDPNKSRRYWQGSNIDVRIEGQVTLRNTYLTPSLSSFAQSAIARTSASSQIYVITAGNLYEIATDGTVTDRGAHGLGSTSIARPGMTTDGQSVYFSADSFGGTTVRRWNGASFSTFSASGADSLAFLNNTLYGFRAAKADLVRYDSAGLATSLFPWKNAAGGIGTASTNGTWLGVYGGKLLILRPQAGSRGDSEVWIYDGTNVSLLFHLEPNFTPNTMIVSNDIIFVSGLIQSTSVITNVGYPAIYYWANGSMGLLWKSPTVYTVGPTICSYDGGICWDDGVTTQILYYNIATGGAHRIINSVSRDIMVSGEKTLLLGTVTSSTLRLFPSTVSLASSGTLISSLYDFDTSLDKIFRGVKVDWSSATGESGASVDIAYQIGGIDGSYTNLQTSAISGVEYNFPVGLSSGRNISIKLTLNKGTSASGPIIKRQYVRAAPLLQTFPQREFIFDLSDNRVLRDGTNHPLLGQEQAKALLTAAQQTIPFTCTDRFGSFNALIDVQDPQGFDIYEVHPLTESEPANAGGTFVGRIKFRGV